MNPFHFIFCCCRNVNNFKAPDSLWLILILHFFVLQEILYVFFQYEFLLNYIGAILICVLYVFLLVFYTQKRAARICEIYNHKYPFLPRFSTLIFIYLILSPMLFFFFILTFRWDEHERFMHSNKTQLRFDILKLFFTF